MTPHTIGLAVLDSLDDKVAVLDLHGDIVYTNTAWKCSGIQNGAAPTRTGEGLNYLDVCRRGASDGDSYATHALNGIERVLAGRQKSFSLEYPCVMTDGEYWYILRATLLRDNGTYVVVSHVDITERKRAEAAQAHLLHQLNEERASLDAVLASAINGIMAFDAVTGRVRANPEAERLFGHPIRPELGRSQYVDQIRDGNGACIPISESLGNRALHGELPPLGEVLIIRPDGSSVPCLANVAPIPSASGASSGFVVVFQDISSLKELERDREEWTSIVAHELRQPIVVIDAQAQRLARTDKLSSDQRATGLASIAKSARRLDRMISDLTDVSRIAAQRLRLSPLSTDLPTLVREAMARLEGALTGHVVRMVVSGPIPPLCLDPTRIEQVVSNLVINAAKYGDSGTDIVVDVSRSDREAIVAVTNTGPGLTVDEISHLFSRFHRTTGAVLSGKEGLGLGLYICRRLVEAHGGVISAESEPNQTTTFRFTLPLSR